MPAYHLVAHCDPVPSRKVRVFRFSSGKLRCSYDESLEAAAEMQKSGSDLVKLEPLDFGRRLAAVSADYCIVT